MNKFYNKALMYQTFLRGKWTLIVGMFLFTFVTILQTVDNMTEIEMNLAQLSSDRVSLRQFPVMLLMLAILVVLYMVITGFNKRNNLTYFHSGPFNKNQIKINEIIFLGFSLLIMIFIYAYINICFYFKNRVLMELCYGYFISYFFNILRMIIAGIIFIGYIIFMDSLFSNLVLAVFSMLAAPLAVLFDVFFVLQLTRQLDLFQNFASNIVENIFSLLEYTFAYLFNLYELNDLIRRNDLWILAVAIFSIVIIVTLYTLIYFSNKKFKVNNMNKLFLLPLVGKITIWFSLFTINLTIFFVLFYINLSKNLYNGDSLILSSSSSTYGLIILFIYLLLSIVVTNLSSKIVNRKLNKINN
ncbi:MAG: hypothetical protein PUE01_12755 [Clostridiaceae bacterium]|nr:hypothetical protein [Clostridiaceae bacterium]